MKEQELSCFSFAKCSLFKAYFIGAWALFMEFSQLFMMII